MTRRAVLYARVSGDDRQSDDRNLLSQLDMCRQYAQDRGWQIVAELHEDDQGASGADFELPQLNHIRELARAKVFDVLVVRELDRLSRSLAKQLILEEEFKHQGIAIAYVLGEYPDTVEGNLMKHVKASIAEFERLKIQERIERGRAAKIRAGSVQGSRPPFGYDLTEQDNRWMLAINETEAEIVRQIFRWYTEGEDGEGPLGTYGIHKKLHLLKVPSPADMRGAGYFKKRGRGEWNRCSVIAILANETYAGTWHWRKTITHNGQRLPGPKETRIAVQVPAIISQKTWEAAVAKRLADRPKGRGGEPVPFLLARRVVCGQCDARVRVQSDRRESGLAVYYRCPARDKSHTQYSYTCDLPYFRADQLEPAVWSWAKSLLVDPAALTKGLDAWRDEEESAKAPLRERIQAIDRRLAENRRASAQLLDQYLVGAVVQEDLGPRKQALDGSDSELLQERAILVARLEEHLPGREVLANLQTFAAEVAEALATTDDAELRRTVIENLDVRVKLAVEDGQKVAHARCILGETRLVISSTGSSSSSR